MAHGPFGRICRLAVAAALVTAGTVAGSWPAAAGPVAAAAQRGLGPGTRFYVPPPSAGAPQQILQLLSRGDRKDAALVTEMEATPRAVWFTSGTPAQVQRQVRQTVAGAAIERAVPVLVAYDIPGRDCAQYSAGGALSQADYQAWISGFARGIGNSHAVVILEPDALGNLPSNCGLPASSYPFTDAERIAELQYAVGALERDPGVSVYLDGTHSAWQSVGTITQRLLAAGVQQAQGFYLNVSNYQPTAELLDYGTWISDCIAMVTDSSNADYNNPAACASQYYPATQSDFSTWDLTTQWYAQNMGGAVAKTRFVVDTSRNGRGPEQHAAVRRRTVRPAVQRHQHPRRRELVQPAGFRPRPAADRQHRRAAARRLPVGEDAGAVGWPVRLGRRRPGVGLRRLHPAGLARHGLGSVPVRPALGGRRPGGRRLVRPAGPAAGPAGQPAAARRVTRSRRW